MDNLNFYKKYFETANDDASQAVHRKYALKLISIAEEQAENNEKLQIENTRLNKTIGSYVGEISNLADDMEGSVSSLRVLLKGLMTS